jgi:hypothetical protein
MDNITPLLPTGTEQLDCDRFNQIINALRERTNHLGTQDCSTTLTGLENCISSSSAFSSLETSVNSLNTSYNTLRDDIYESTGYIQGLINNSSTLLNARIDGIVTQSNNNNNVITSLTSSVNTVGARVGVLELDMNTVKTSIDNIEGLLGIDFAVANIVRLDGINTYTNTSTINDFRATTSFYVPPINKNYQDVILSDSNAISLGWLKAEVRNLLTEDLLTKDNAWEGINTYERPPHLLLVPGLNDLTNEAVSATWVRANMAANFLSGTIPIIYKDPSNANRLLWTAGTLTFNGIDYSIPAGGYTYTQDGQFYVIADSTGNVININANSQTSPGSSETNKQILGEVNVTINSANNYNIRQVKGLTLRIGDFAAKSIANTFNASNTFNEESYFNGDTNFKGKFTLDTTATATTKVKIISTATIEGNPTDNYLATTDWVKSRVAEGVLNYDSINNLVVFNDDILEDNTIISLGGRKVYVDEPSKDSNDNQIATTKFINEKVDGNIVVPSFEVTPNTLILNYGDGYVPLPEGKTCTGSLCIGGNTCKITSGKIDLSLNTKLVYLDYVDCRVRTSSELIPDEVGKVLGYIDINVDENNTSSNNYNVTVTPVSTTLYAPTNSPSFSGEPKVPTPPEESDSSIIPNTEWVQDRLYDLLHKPCDVKSTTRPSVVDKGGLTINLTPGYITEPNGSDIFVNTLTQDLALVDNATEYIYFRYFDDKIVASTTEPHFTDGLLIARVITNNAAIIAIYHAQGFTTTCTAITSNYKVGFGGRIIYVPNNNNL